MNASGIDLYTWATPNGWKASCTLEELQLPYTVYPLDIMKKQHKTPEYSKLNPNEKIPAIVDHDVGDFCGVRVWRHHDLSRREGGSTFACRVQSPLARDSVIDVSDGGRGTDARSSKTSFFTTFPSD